MSNINTNSINTSYPTPGVNNSTQGMRDNFTSIQTNLNIAAAELTDLQHKTVVKSALANTTLNNDMANTLISNAAVQGFRHTTYNLGDNLSGNVAINVANGDVLYGTITGNVVLNFGDWAPTGTKSSIDVRLYIGNTAAVINFPNTKLDNNALVVSGMTATARLLENYGSNAAPAASVTYTNLVTVPTNVYILDYTFSTMDCGTTIDVFPTNRNQVANEITIRNFSAPGASRGLAGDAGGLIATDGQYLYICSGVYDGSTDIWGRVALSGF
jgi:hypothetical protein